MSTYPAFQANDPKALEAFNEHGVVCLRGAIDAHWLSRLDQAIDGAVENPGPGHFRFGEPNQPGWFFGDTLVWQRQPTFKDFAFEGPLADIAGRLMQSQTVTFYHDFLLIKSSGSNKNTPWHQDQSYWCFSGDQALTIWAPLDPVSMANTLQFVRGSHKTSPLFEAVPFDKSSSFNGSRDNRPAVPNVEQEIDPELILQWELEPGDCLIFHARTLHAAPGNPLPHARRVLSTCWAGDDASFIQINSDMAPSVVDPALKPGDHLASATFPMVRDNRAA